MLNRFSKVGATAFPGDPGRQACSVYEWTCRYPGVRGQFTIPFLSPDDPSGPRIFLVEPLMRSWVKGRRTTFLEDACAFGCKVLAEWEAHAKDEKQEYRLCQHLFRQRDSGHMHITSQFDRVVHFVDFYGGPEPKLVTPGIDASEETVAAVMTNRSGSPHAKAKRLLWDALKPYHHETAHQLDSAKKTRHRPHLPILGLKDVLNAYDVILERERRLTQRGRRTVCLPLDQLPGRSELDLLFTDGWRELPVPWSLSQTIDKVRSALVYSPVDQDSLDLACSDRAVAQRFCDELHNATNCQSSFDKTWARARQHRFLTLVGGTRLVGQERDKMAAQAQCIASWLMWIAHERMARCWGMLMMLAMIDFAMHSDQVPTHEEWWLFRQWHFPQLYLGGLPLDFMGRPQLRWIIPTLHKLWAQGITDPVAYTKVTDLLGLFGASVRNSRDADNQRPPTRQERHGRSADEQRPPTARGGRRATAANDSDVDKKGDKRPSVAVRPRNIDNWDGVPAKSVLSSDAECPECGYDLSVVGPSVYCERCDSFLSISDSGAKFLDTRKETVRCVA